MTTMIPTYGLENGAQMMITNADPDVMFSQQLHCNGSESGKSPHPHHLTRMSGDTFLLALHLHESLYTSGVEHSILGNG